MRELAKGTCGSVIVHALALGLFSLATMQLAMPGGGVRSVGLSLGSGAGRGKSGGRGSAVRTVDVSRLSRTPPASATKRAAAKSSVAVKAKPRPTPVAATAKTATSRTGPVVLKDQRARPETAAERIERIRRSAQAVAATPTSSARSSSRDAVDRDTIAERVRQRLQGSGVASSGSAAADTDGDGAGGGAGADGGGGAGDPFFGALSDALYEAWDPPSTGEVGGANPEVGVSITMRSDGTVTAYRLVRTSGVAPMDSSVLRLLRRLRVLPAPAKFGLAGPTRTIEITFTLDAVQER